MQITKHQFHEYTTKTPSKILEYKHKEKSQLNHKLRKLACRNIQINAKTTYSYNGREANHAWIPNVRNK